MEYLDMGERHSLKSMGACLVAGDSSHPLLQLDPCGVKLPIGIVSKLTSGALILRRKRLL